MPVGPTVKLHDGTGKAGDGLMDVNELIAMVREKMDIDTKQLSDDDLHEVFHAMDSDMSGTVNAGELGVFIQRGKKLNAKHAKLGKQELSGSTESAALPSSLAGPYPRGRKHKQKEYGELSPAASAVAAAGHISISHAAA